MRAKPSLRAAGGSPSRAANDADVAAGHEVPARAAQHDHAQAVVGGDRRRVRDERIDHRVVEDVELVRAIERQRRDRDRRG